MSDDLPQYKSQIEQLKEKALNRPLKESIKPVNRLSIVKRITHEPLEDAPKQFTSSSSENLSGEEECYSRRKVLGEQWEKLDLGFLDETSVGYVIIENLEGMFLHTNPSEEEKALLPKKRILIKSDFGIFIPPGQMFDCHPSDVSKIEIRAELGPIKYKVHILPR